VVESLPRLILSAIQWQRRRHRQNEKGEWKVQISEARNSFDNE
jgi:hypothetical protein